MKIALDGIPLNSLPFESTEYNSLLCCSLLYEPLFHIKNNQFIENLIIDKSKNNLVIFKIKKFFWSNGEKIKPKDIANTLFYIIKNKPNIASYLDFIIGVPEYLEDKKDIKKIKINFDDNYIYIETARNDNYYKFVFSSIIFAPVYFFNNKPLKTITSGAYKLITPENLFEYIKNPLTKYNVDKNLTIISEDNFNKNIELFSKKNIDITSTTIFDSRYKDIIKPYNNFLYEKKSNITLRIVLKDYLFMHKNEIKCFLKNLFHDFQFLNEDIYINDSILNNKNRKSNFKNINKNITILYSDYYPNNFIGEKLYNFLKNKNYSINKKCLKLNEFMEEYKNNNFDVCIDVVFPITLSKYDYFLEKINFFNDKYIDKYIYLLNKWQESDYSSVFEKYIFDFIENYSLLIEIGKIKHKYLSRNDNIYLLDNDLFKFKINI